MKYRFIQDTRQLFLWSMGVIYLFAFVSLYLQIPGLYGPNGLLPVYNTIPKQQQENLTLSEHLKSLYKFPSILIYYDYLELSPELAMELCCVAGALLSFCVIVFQSMRCSYIFFILWMLYLSLHQVGQTFLYFQWDSLLLEAGALTILVAPFFIMFWKKPLPRPHDSCTMWLVRWLLFRLMFASGIVKLTSYCPTWWGLTALNWHYESQCIPTPLAWYAHQLPEWFQSLSIVGTYYIEIITPFFFFLPIRSLRIYAFWTQVFFQLCIIATGNYNFFNLLTITLCISLLDDGVLNSTFLWKKRKTPKDWSRKFFKRVFGQCDWLLYGLGKFVIFCSVVGASIGVVIYFFSVEFDLENYIVHTEIAFTKKEFHSALYYAVQFAAVMGVASLSFHILRAILDSLSKQGPLNQLWFIIQTFLMSGVVIAMFSASLVPLSYLDTRSIQNHFPNELWTVHNYLEPLRSVSPYGLFRRMTGVGGRPELIIEGTNDQENGPWKEYEFLYKPGNPYKPLPLVAPHQPRLDWQMWFAALGNYEQNPWLVQLVHKLLQGEKDVLELLATPPFNKPPKYIRVSRYEYHYTKYDHSLSLLNQTGPWWKREYKGEYLFSLSLEHAGLTEYIKKMGVDKIPPSQCNIDYLCTIMYQIRAYSKLLPPTEVCLATITMATLLQFTLSLMPLLFDGKPNKPIDYHRTINREIPLEERREQQTLHETDSQKVKEKRKNKRR